jgi:2-polyprenyl-3-methyl-5-hydroxy-6-metoxy-1,4-benzoquinol methylase
MSRNYKGIPINTTKYTHESVFKLVKKNKDSIIVDIPSGSGAFVLRLKDAGYKNIKAVDIENILQIEHNDFVVGDMTQKLPFDDKSCETVVCIDGIEHINKQYDFVKETNRILKNNGDFIVSTPNISSLRSRWKWLMTGHHHKCNAPLNENNPTPLHHIAMISFHELRYLLHTNGLIIEKVTTNRIKFISLLFAVFIPFVFLSTLIVYKRSGRREGTKMINKEIMRKMFSVAVLFGETIIIRAVKKNKTS